MANSKASPPGGSDVMMYVMHVPGGRERGGGKCAAQLRNDLCLQSSSSAGGVGVWERERACCCASRRHSLYRPK